MYKRGGRVGTVCNVDIDNLNRIRKSRKISICDLMEQSGCNHSKMADVIRGRSHFFVEDVEKMAKVLNVPIKEIIMGEAHDNLVQELYTQISVHIKKTSDGKPQIQIFTAEGTKYYTAENIDVSLDDSMVKISLSGE